jgi:hypothetical protein
MNCIRINLSPTPSAEYLFGIEIRQLSFEDQFST